MNGMTLHVEGLRWHGPDHAARGASVVGAPSLVSLLYALLYARTSIEDAFAAEKHGCSLARLGQSAFDTALRNETERIVLKRLRKEDPPRITRFG